QLMEPSLEHALLALEQVDPSFGPTIYYTIIGTALASIPVVTSQMILGMASVGSGMIAAGMKLQSSEAGAASGYATSQDVVLSTRGLYNDAITGHVKDSLASFASGGAYPKAFDGLTEDARKQAYQIWEGGGINHWINNSINMLDKLGSGAAFGEHLL